MPAVAIVGRKNVGKSTIFNRLTGARQSIVYKEPGVTRDRVYGQVEWRGRSFDLIDTGGFFPDEEFTLARSIQRQIENALKEADLIYFVVDGRAGLKPTDREISGELRKTGKPVLLLVNKIDNDRTVHHAAEFHALGHEQIFPVSAEAGFGFGDVMDATLAKIPMPPVGRRSDVIRLLILGRPNSGKSTLLNAFLKEERAIVDARPGTTRDVVNVRLEYEGRAMEIIDTAGIRKRSRISEPIEFYSVMRAIKMIDRASVVILTFDTKAGVVDQDQRIAALVLSKARCLIVAPNKIDLIDARDRHRIIPSTVKSMPSLDFVPVIPISAKLGTNVDKLMSRVLDIDRESGKTVDQSTLDALTGSLKAPPDGAILKLRQTGSRPPIFEATVTTRVKESYIKYLRNQIRNYFGFSGIPILLRTALRGKTRRR